MKHDETLWKELADERGIALYRQSARVEALESALRIIAGYEQCIDNLMSHQEIARAVLAPEQRK